jgi:hypothetical protein
MSNLVHPKPSGQRSHEAPEPELEVPHSTYAQPRGDRTIKAAIFAAVLLAATPAWAIDDISGEWVGRRRVASA